MHVKAVFRQSVVGGRCLQPHGVPDWCRCYTAHVRHIHPHGDIGRRDPDTGGCRGQRHLLCRTCVGAAPWHSCFPAEAFAGQLLDSGRRLPHYNIVNGSTTILVTSELPPLMPSRIELPRGDSFRPMGTHDRFALLCSRYHHSMACSESRAHIKQHGGHLQLKHWSGPLHCFRCSIWCSILWVGFLKCASRKR